MERPENGAFLFPCLFSAVKSVTSARAPGTNALPKRGNPPFILSLDSPRRHPHRAARLWPNRKPPTSWRWIRTL